MSFHNVPYPLLLQYGSEFGASMSVAVQQLASGAENRIERWAAERRVYNGAQGVLSRDDVNTLRRFWRARGMSAHSFPLLDPTDYASTANGRTDPTAVTNADQVLGTGDGTTVDFQIVTRYSDAEVTVVRNIEKPKSGTVLVAVATVAKTEGVDFTVDYATGIVSFAAAPAMSANITCGFQFYVPVRFGSNDAAQFNYTQQGFDAGSANVPLIEVFGESALDEDGLPGFGSIVVPANNRVLETSTDGAAIRLQPTADRDVRLPLATARTIGGTHFALWNDSAFTITLKSGGSTVGTLAAGDIKRCFVFPTSTSKVWKVF